MQIFVNMGAKEGVGAHNPYIVQGSTVNGMELYSSHWEEPVVKEFVFSFFMKQ